MQSSDINWTEVAAIGQAIAAIAGIVGLFFVGFQLRASRQSTDLKNLQKFFEETTNREHALFASKESETDQSKAFVEFVNFLEIYAAAYNKRLIGGISREQIRDQLIETLAVIETNTWSCKKLNEAVTSRSALKELRHFKTRFQKKIDGIIAEENLRGN